MFPQEVPLQVRLERSVVEEAESAYLHGLFLETGAVREEHKEITVRTEGQEQEEWNSCGIFQTEAKTRKSLISQMFSYGMHLRGHVVGGRVTSQQDKQGCCSEDLSIYGERALVLNSLERIVKNLSLSSSLWQNTGRCCAEAAAAVVCSPRSGSMLSLRDLALKNFARTTFLIWARTHTCSVLFSIAFRLTSIPILKYCPKKGGKRKLFRETGSLIVHKISCMTQRDDLLHGGVET